MLWDIIPSQMKQSACKSIENWLACGDFSHFISESRIIFMDFSDQKMFLISEPAVAYICVMGHQSESNKANRMRIGPKLTGLWSFFVIFSKKNVNQFH